MLGLAFAGSAGAAARRLADRRRRRLRADDLRGSLAARAALPRARPHARHLHRRREALAREAGLGRSSTSTGARPSRRRTSRARASARCAGSSGSASASSAARSSRRQRSTRPRSTRTSTASQRALDRPRVEPSLRLRGLDAEIVPGRNGRLLDREAAQQVLVRSLTGLSREPVPLAAESRPDAALREGSRRRRGQGRDRALGARRPRVRPGRLAPDAREDREAARAAERRLDRDRARRPCARTRFFANLRKRVNHAPKDAGFAIGARNVVRVVPAEAGRALDMAGDDSQPDGGAPLDDESQGRARGHVGRARAHDRATRRRWASPGSSAPTRPSTAASRTGSTTSSSSRT